MNASNVTAAKPRTTGVVYYAALGTTLPTDADTALSSDFKELGHLSEDGFTHNFSKEADTIRDMGGTPILTVQTDTTDEVKCTFMELQNVEVLKALYGESNVTGALATGISIIGNADEATSCVWVFETIGRDGALHRLIYPNAKISEMGEITYKRDEAVSCEVTIAASADTNGNTHYKYIKSA